MTYMTVLQKIAAAIFLNKPELFREIRQSLCKHKSQDEYYDKDDGSYNCLGCGKLLGYFDGAAYDEYDAARDNQLV